MDYKKMWYIMLGSLIGDTRQQAQMRGKGGTLPPYEAAQLLSRMVEIEVNEFTACLEAEHGVSGAY